MFRGQDLENTHVWKTQFGRLTVFYVLGFLWMLGFPFSSCQFGLGRAEKELYEREERAEMQQEILKKVARNLPVYTRTAGGGEAFTAEAKTAFGQLIPMPSNYSKAETTRGKILLHHCCPRCMWQSRRDTGTLSLSLSSCLSLICTTLNQWCKWYCLKVFLHCVFPFLIKMQHYLYLFGNKVLRDPLRGYFSANVLVCSVVTEMHFSGGLIGFRTTLLSL